MVKHNFSLINAILFVLFVRVGTAKKDSFMKRYLLAPSRPRAHRTSTVFKFVSFNTQQY